MSNTAVMLMSGGIESAVVAAMISSTTSEYYVNVRRALMVNYGQRAWEQEYKSAVYLCNKYGIFLETVVLDMPFLQGNTLVDDNVVATYDPQGGGRGHIVPYRNLIFLGIASSYAASVHTDDEDVAAIMTGFDFDASNAGAALDKSESFVEALEEAIDWAREGPKIKVVSPLNYAPIGKSANIKRALNLGVNLSKTWSCYNDGRLHCGGCGSCVLRRSAFLEIGMEDPAGVLPIEECEPAIVEARERLEYV